MITNNQTQEDKTSDSESGVSPDHNETEINLDTSEISDDQVHHVYDILANINQSETDVVDDEDLMVTTPEDAVLSGDLHPTILFALKQKWVFDKSGNWHDETQKFKASTDRRGQLDPAKSEDKDEMMIWLEDYLKRRKK